MKFLAHSCLILLLALTVHLQAKDATPAPHYVNPTVVDWKTLLANPPADGSAETKKELALILEKQNTRTPTNVARAESESQLKVFVFADVLGSWFTEKNLPVTTAFFQNIDDDSMQVAAVGKKLWARPRPPLQDKDVHPAVELPKTGSYPSAHALRGVLFAAVLAEMEPSLKDKLLARGKEIGDDRVLAGVHFPSDVAAGQKVGEFLEPKFDASPAFQADLAKVKAELDAASAKH